MVVWDAEDPHTDAFLKAALVTARALAFRTAKQSDAQAADFVAIDRAILQIEKVPVTWVKSKRAPKQSAPRATRSSNAWRSIKPCSRSNLSRCARSWKN